ncbi:hypothetical protein V1523DRAFT_139696 [Lipomyces doorenjongii]
MVVLLCTMVSRFQETSVRAVDSAGHLTSISHLISGSHLGFTVIIGFWFIFFLEQFCTKADPLSIGAGVAGIIVPLLHGSRLLLDDLQCSIGALTPLETLKTDLSSVSMALTLLKAVKDVEWGLLGDVVVYQAKATSRTCAKACDLFRTDQQRWTKSDAGKLSWQNRAPIGFLKQRQINLPDQHELGSWHCDTTSRNSIIVVNSNSVVKIQYASIRSTNIRVLLDAASIARILRT